MAIKISFSDVTFAELASYNREIIDILEKEIECLKGQLKRSAPFMGHSFICDSVISLGSCGCGYDNYLLYEESLIARSL